MLFIATSLCAPLHHELTSAYTYEQYQRDFGKTSLSSADHTIRKAIFQARLAAILKHNAGKSSFKKGVNKFTDMTEHERSAFLGYRPGKNFGGTVQVDRHEVPSGFRAPSQIDWRTKNVLTDIKDQASCGGCWAFAATEAIESSFAVSTGNLPPPLSPEQILRCTPNPNQCGGTGGCGGATAELAYTYVQSVAGLTTESRYPYQSGNGNTGNCDWSANQEPPLAKVTGWVQADVNNQTAVLSLLTAGPVSIGVDASAWFDYENGVYDECNGESSLTLDHAVQLVGYSNGQYWIVRNSWGEGWGESGFIRLAHTTQCVPDNDPASGSGCKGGPPSISVCGACGLFYEVSWPTATSASP